MVLREAGSGHRSVHGRDRDVFRQPFHKEGVFPFQALGSGGFRLQGGERESLFRCPCGVRRLIWLAFDGWGMGGALQEGGWSYPQVVHVMECYVVVAFRGGSEITVLVSRYGAEEYSFPVGGSGQGLFQGARTLVRAPRGAFVHSADMGSGTAYMLKPPAMRLVWWGMMVRSSANRSVRYSPWIYSERVP